MLSAAGEMLCHTDRKKLEWYLAKGIAVKVGRQAGWQAGWLRGEQVRWGKWDGEWWDAEAGA